MKALLSTLPTYPQVKNMLTTLSSQDEVRVGLHNLLGSSFSLFAAQVAQAQAGLHLFIFEDKERAGFFYNDLERLFGEHEMPFEKRRILFFPATSKLPYAIEQTDNSNIVLRTEVLNKTAKAMRNLVVVTTPEALSEKVVTRRTFNKKSFNIKVGELLDMETLIDALEEYGFEREPFVFAPGQFSIRGGIIDLFSYSNDIPFRIEFLDDEVASIRSFNPSTQLKVETLSHIYVVANIQDRISLEERQTLLAFIPTPTAVWIDAIDMVEARIGKALEKAKEHYSKLSGAIQHLAPETLFTEPSLFREQILNFRLIEFGIKPLLATQTLHFTTESQPLFQKDFERIRDSLTAFQEEGFTNLIFAENKRQQQRIISIMEDISPEYESDTTLFNVVPFSLHQGFIDHDLKITCFTAHQLFERYHRFTLRDNFSAKEKITLDELNNLKKGDYVTHIDYGIGQFDGLETMENCGKKQESVRIIYKNDDLLYISIHSLHKIAKYVGKEGTAPTLHKLGSGKWQLEKSKTKKRVKDIARDLIQLYARRKSAKGFSFSPDTYMQHELEGSFIYEDTPDQHKATQDTKRDMEANFPMDRLVCGDVGFGKTEIAIRVAFKAVADSKQVAILVPTTILAMQHYNTFSERLKEFPCNIDYINRFKSAKQQRASLERLENGKCDILIGTHILLNDKVKFKDLGLLIIDEEHKFGVSAKEKLRKLRVNIDTLALTATPIPRTLQFSMLGARDLSVINTAPTNRHPIQTELLSFNEETIRDAIMSEVSRNGQVIFVNNRIGNIGELAGMIQRICPDVRIAIGHGQMEGKKLEQIMLDFMDNMYDVLVATTIIESGLDIPNANTIIINEAHHFGLSDLHQIRGRVGRSNRKAFCYLIAPPLTALPDHSRKRLQAVLEFSNLGGGFNIAMRDLDIRGAGNLLGGEQSGFISNVGFNMYQKILKEAMLELKEKEFSVQFSEDQTAESIKEFVSDCQIETDLAVMLPQEYIPETAERLSLYKAIDNLQNEDDMLLLISNLTDRFGPLPEEAQGLFDIVRVRWMAKSMGIERLILRNNTLRLGFPADQTSSFYQSTEYMLFINYISKNPKRCKMQENRGKLSLTIKDTTTIRAILTVLKSIQKT